MEVIKSMLNGCLLLEPQLFTDSRGSFHEAYNQKVFESILGYKQEFVQDNVSCSKKSVLRGMHFQENHPQGKLVRVAKGKVFDVALDLRKNSASFGKWDSVVLSSENNRQFWIPEGFAHGFLVLSEIAIFEYKCTKFYNPNDEVTLIWNDPDLAIDWPTSNPIISEKDARGISFSSFIK